MKNGLRLSLLGILIVLMLSACHEKGMTELSRFSPHNLTSPQGEFFIAEDSLRLEANQTLELWSDMDYSYSGDQNLLFRVVIFVDGEYLREFYINPSSTENRERESRSQDGDRISESYYGLNGPIEIQKAGDYNFKVLLMGQKDPSLEIRKADLVLKGKK
ncbi:hypothetical protein [Croceimicrobium sp.]|uniref:hypothetical protein n=1 Tax=Croceimicrobium sp. TaxID=2828340 RepID=UPI003BA90B82